MNKLIPATNVSNIYWMAVKISPENHDMKTEPLHPYQIQHHPPFILLIILQLFPIKLWLVTHITKLIMQKLNTTDSCRCVCRIKEAESSGGQRVDVRGYVGEVQHRLSGVKDTNVCKALISSYCRRRAHRTHSRLQQYICTAPREIDKRCHVNHLRNEKKVMERK